MRKYAIVWFALWLNGCKVSDFIPDLSALTPHDLSTQQKYASTSEDNSVVLDLYYEDPLGMTADGCAFAQVSHGVLSDCVCSVDKCSSTFYPEPNFFGTVPPIAFQIHTADRSSPTNGIFLEVNPVDDAPAVSNFTVPVSVQVGQSMTVTLPYTDVENDLAQTCSVSNPVRGSLGSCLCTTGTCRVSFTGSNAGTASFQYRVVSNGHASEDARVNLVVDPQPDPPPAAQNTSVTTLQNQAVVVTLSYTGLAAQSCATQNAMNGSVGACSCTSGICTVSFNPTMNFMGTAGFDFRVTSNGLASNLAHTTVTVNAPAPPACPVSSVTWQNTAFNSQSQGLEITFDGIPSANNIDGLTAFSAASGTVPADFAVLLRFNNVGRIDAINGGTASAPVYQSVDTIPYSAGSRYRFRAVISVPAHTYSAYVTPPGSAQELTVANNYSFRGNQSSVTRLANWGFQASSGSHQVCSLTVTGFPIASGTGVPPIARWNAVPRQRVGQGQTLNAGVVAFSKEGIQRVRFTINGPGVSNRVVDVTQMTWNPHSETAEYWTPVRASDFSGYGIVQLDAEVTGRDGGVRNKNTAGDNGGLQTFELVVDPSNTMPQQYVNLTGGQTFASGVYSSATTWLIVRTTPGSSTRATLQGATSVSGYVKFENVILSGNQIPGPYWLDNSAVVGSGRWPSGGVGASNPAWNASYVTNTTFTNVGRVLNGVYARGVRATSIGEDFSQNQPMVVNSSVDGIDPGTTGWHSDAWQLWGDGTDDNMILYNFKGTNLKYQGVMIGLLDGAPPSRGIALVNVLMQGRDPNNSDPNARPISMMQREIDHFILWNCYFDHMFGFYNDTSPVNQRNHSIRGNIFYAFQYNNAGIDYATSIVEDNHFEQIVPVRQWTAIGDQATTGDPRLGPTYHPLSGSPLLNRIVDSYLLFDLDNALRAVTGSTVGPYER